MDNGFFCNKCGMIKNRCVCNKNIATNFKPVARPKMNYDLIKEEYPNIDDDIIKNFPFKNPREGQLEIIDKLTEALDSEYPYLILEAGTGTGKSAVATTLARIYQPAYILTMTKQLQSQYAQEFGYPLVKGRGNFTCLESGAEFNCDLGTCQTVPSSQEFACPYGITKGQVDGGGFAFEDAFNNPIYFRGQERCNYWDQKARSVQSNITLMNYDYGLLELNYVKHFGKRRLMILDEAHNLEDKMMRRLEVNLSRQRLEKDVKKVIPPSFLEYEDAAEWTIFIETIYDAYQELSLKKLSKKQADRINGTKLRLSELLKSLEDEPDNWVVHNEPQGVSFKPLRVDGFTKDRLFNYADSCLFMSATILDKDLFSKWLGLGDDEVFYLQVPSTFPAGNRPIHMNLAGNMSQRVIKRTAPKSIPILEKIIAHHRYEKGLIHTHNYKCQQYVLKKINNSRMMGHDSKNREYSLYEFEKSREPRVLVSPSMSEGVDLPYEQCQFQVIYKIPFPYLGDPQVRQRKNKDPQWYAYKTVLTLLQAYGRGMRAEDDYCETYILDGNIRMLLTGRMYRNLIPTFFKEAIVRKG